MSVWTLLLLPALAQSPPPSAAPPEAPKPAPAPQNSGIERQRDSIRKQIQSAAQQGGAPASSNSFFTYAWTPTPLSTTLPPPEAGTATEGPPPATPTASNISAACDPLTAQVLDPILDKASSQHGVERNLLRAIMEQESAFRPCAVSPKGAQGLMQLMPATASELQVSDPFDPEQSILGGARFLKQLLEKYKGNLSLTLSAYNAGPARVDKDGRIPDVPETQDYVRRVLAKLGKVPDIQTF
ncbi:MAG: lytic transglycosylase domain-containing protein [Bryobacterales bacterium]|nr:lytic transglycosylase domain-containing protein [Bryobacterales bacterium]